MNFERCLRLLENKTSAECKIVALMLQLIDLSLCSVGKSYLFCILVLKILVVVYFCKRFGGV